MDPQAGREQKGRRRVGMAILCPVTTTDRRIPFHLPIPPSAGLTGFVMVEQIKSLDFKNRGGRFLGKVPEHFLAEVLAVVEACLGDPG
jgi:mRNA interferase MazF